MKLKTFAKTMTVFMLIASVIAMTGCVDDKPSEPTFEEKRWVEVKNDVKVVEEAMLLELSKQDLYYLMDMNIVPQDLYDLFECENSLTVVDITDLTKRNCRIHYELITVDEEPTIENNYTIGYEYRINLKIFLDAKQQTFNGFVDIRRTSVLHANKTTIIRDEYGIQQEVHPVIYGRNSKQDLLNFTNRNIHKDYLEEAEYKVGGVFYND